MAWKILTHSLHQRFKGRTGLSHVDFVSKSAFSQLSLHFWQINVTCSFARGGPTVSICVWLACLLPWGTWWRSNIWAGGKGFGIITNHCLKSFKPCYAGVCYCCGRKRLKTRHTLLINRDLKSCFYLIWAWRYSVLLNSFGNTKIFNSHVVFKVLWGRWILCNYLLKEWKVKVIFL